MMKTKMEHTSISQLTIYTKSVFVVGVLEKIDNISIQFLW